MDAFISFVQKDPNELWKFLGFLFSCLYNLSAEKENVKIVARLIENFGQRS
jgi:hypothetical protein